MIALAASATARADDVADTYDAARDTSSELGDARFASPAAVCRALVASEVRELAISPPSQIDESIVAHAPHCLAEATPLPFVGDRTWKSLWVIHSDDGVGKASRLVAQTPSGYVLVPVAWDVDDPRDPGCPSIVRDIGIDGAAVQHGRLVIIMAGERTTYVDPVSEDDPGARMELVRSPHWSSDANGGTTFKTTDPWTAGSTLGSKVQPGGPHGRWVAWGVLAWQGFRSLQVDPTGAVHVSPLRDD